MRRAYNQSLDEIGTEGVGELKAWPARARAATAEKYSYKVRDRVVVGDNYTESLARQPIPKLAVPKFRDWGEILHFLATENLPGSYPYTGGVYPYRREEEDPTRMFAGEGAPGKNQQALPLSGGRSRRGETVDGVRLDDAVWRGSGHSPRCVRPYG